MHHRELVVFLTDEAQRFSKLANSSRQQVQMDALQSMASMTNTLHGLFGTYELLEFRNLSGHALESVAVAKQRRLTKGQLPSQY